MLSDKDIISTSRKYNLRPGSLKCEVYALFDRGYSGAEVKYLLKGRSGSSSKIFTRTIDRYRYSWKRL